MLFIFIFFVYKLKCKNIFEIIFPLKFTEAPSPAEFISNLLQSPGSGVFD